MPLLSSMAPLALLRHKELENQMRTVPVSICCNEICYFSSDTTIIAIIGFFFPLIWICIATYGCLCCDLSEINIQTLQGLLLNLN